MTTPRRQFLRHLATAVPVMLAAPSLSLAGDIPLDAMSKTLVVVGDSPDVTEQLPSNAQHITIHTDDSHLITAIEQYRSGFLIRLSNGTSIATKKLICPSFHTADSNRSEIELSVGGKTIVLSYHREKSIRTRLRVWPESMLTNKQSLHRFLDEEEPGIICIEA